MTDKHHSGCGLEQVTYFEGDQVGAQDEDRALHTYSSRLRPRYTRPNQSLERGLEILRVGRGPFIQDYQIDSQLLHPPIFVGEEYLVNDLQITGFIDADQDDR